MTNNSGISAQEFKTNVLFYGDNLDILRRYIPNESIDLIYLDPPFNSKADYNILFKEATGEESTAQIQAFSDFWHWDDAARHAYEFLTSNEVDAKVSDVTDALYRFLGKNDMTAYLFMMARRLLELHRVLKSTGSLFLHCDSTASHYLKLVLDAIFGIENFRNEVVWKRFNFHADARRFGRVADRILFYSKTSEYKFNRQRAPFKQDYVDSKFTHKEGNRRFRLSDLNPPALRGPIYEFHGITRPWRFTKEKMLQLEKEGRIYTDSKVPQLKRYLDELEAAGGAAVHEIWDDIPAINSQAKERLGYPTQKPTELLERIINACTDGKDDWVLDPFCGCGTTIAAAEKLRRHWIGIDITYLAISLVKGRLRDSFPDAKFEVEGEPRDLGAAVELAKNRYQFQWWALSLIGARPTGSTEAKPREGRKGADEGVDGWLRFPVADHFERIVVSVKSGHVGVKDIRELRDTVSRQKAAMGMFITLEEPTSEMIKEVKVTEPYISPTWHHEYPKLQILTVEELLKGKRPSMPQVENSFKKAPTEERATRSTSTKLFQNDKRHGAPTLSP